MFTGICSSYLYEDVTGFKKEKDVQPTSIQTPPTQRRLAKSLSVAPSSVSKGICFAHFPFFINKAQTCTLFKNFRFNSVSFSFLCVCWCVCVQYSSPVVKEASYLIPVLLCFSPSLCFSVLALTRDLRYVYISETQSKIYFKLFLFQLAILKKIKQIVGVIQK